MKRFLLLASIVLVTLGAAACTREKPPVEEPTPTGVAVQNLTPAATLALPPVGVVPTLAPGAATTGGAPTGVVTATVSLPPAIQTATAPGAAATPTITAGVAPTVAPPAGTQPTAAAPPTVAAPTTVPGLTAPTAAPVAPGTATTYTVQWGDWLNKIAGQFGVTTQAIIAANPGLNPNRIYPGQVLNIPAAGSEPPPVTPGPTTAPGTEPTVAPPPSTNPGTYTVQRGDWFYAIARKFAISVSALAAANPGINPNFIYPGQVLNIPGGGTPGNPPPPSPGGGTTYIVRYGDTLSSIAFRFGKSVYALQIANHLANPNFIFPGQRLIIP